MKLNAHLDRLVLMVAIALYGAVSPGFRVQKTEVHVHQKNPRPT